MAPLRVLIVEDSLTMRIRLRGALGSDPGIEIVAEAEDGKQAIALCERHRPDIITMDMMLPSMTGLAATEYIMAHCPTPILIVSSSVNRGELFRSYDALAAGAVDILDKPMGTEPDGLWEQKLVTLVKRVARIRVITHPRARLSAARAPQGDRPAPASCAVVAIGASTGGPAAIAKVLRDLPASFRLPILFVLHINDILGIGFADWLDAQTGRRVSYPKEGEPVAAAAGRVIMAPADRHLVVRNGHLQLTTDPERHSCRPSVDVLFDSVAESYGAAAAGCLLTGMGRDGAQGLLKIREAGGTTFAQDERSSVVFGMPREAIALGAARHILGLDEIGAALSALA
jgi:two-component system chemotaxis response regulator CheB